MNKPTQLNEKKILIITGGYVDEEFVKSLLLQEEYSIIIAADRGLLTVDRLKLEPDYILGDFDSVPRGVLLKYKDKAIPIETFPTMKDKTDTHIAFEKALELNPSLVDLVGATGTRLDHTLSNMDLLMLALDKGVCARILDFNNKIYLKRKSFIVNKRDQHGDFISLLSFSLQVKGLRLEGFKYPLDGITLKAGSSLGVSNELISEEGRVEFDEGILAVFETRD